MSGPGLFLEQVTLYFISDSKSFNSCVGGSSSWKFYPTSIQNPYYSLFSHEYMKNQALLEIWIMTYNGLATLSQNYVKHSLCNINHKICYGGLILGPSEDFLPQICNSGSGLKHLWARRFSELPAQFLLNILHFRLLEIGHSCA